MEKKKLTISTQDYNSYLKLKNYCDSYQSCEECIFSNWCECKLIDTLSQTIEHILEKVTIEKDE